jgi:hypothetical protein
MQWHFNRPKPGDKNREPVLGEFFATEAITNPAEALVREGSQNSLDAGSDNIVQIRIYVSGQAGALSASSVSPFLEGAWSHIQAAGNGLRDAPNPTDPCSILTFEDFGTSGLVGDVTQWHDEMGTVNPFYYFFRAEGQSGKGEQDRGRWGVGKTVFPRSSRISSYFGFTVRSDDQRLLLMGQSVLKSHSVGGEYFSPDGYFGVRREDGLTLPIDNTQLIDTFRETFGLKRDTEPGLSVVVPFCDAEITEQTLIQGVCRDYFYPILAAKLEFVVATPLHETLINHATIPTVAQTFAAQLPDDLPPILQLAAWSTEVPPNQFITLHAPPSDGALEWSADLMREEQVLDIRSKLQAGDRIAVRVPLVVREKNQEPRSSFFDVFLVGDSKSERGRPVFVREGIIISDIRAPRSRGVVSLVVVENDALATLLGDSENPAHTQWQKDSSNYKGKYVYGPSYIRFVVNSVSQIVRLVTEGEDETDRSLLADLFYLPIEKEIPASEEEVKESEDQLKRLISSTQARVRVRKVSGGFTISNASNEGTAPPFFEVRVAYDVRRGNPLNKYDGADFDLSSLPMKFDGVEIKSKKGNRMTATVLAPQFNLTVTGFDEHRDLFVRVNPKEELNDSQD